MKLKPLQQWICDSCGELIKSPKDGYLEWVSNDEHRFSGFRIVHHAPRSPRAPNSDCYAYTNKPGGMDNSLELFIGSRGLVELLSMLDVGPYHNPEFNHPDVEDMRNFVEVFRRLHLPYYEEARLYWNEALESGYFVGANEVWIYLPETLEELVRRFAPKERKTSR